MAVIPRLIARYAIVLYVLCAVGAFLYVWAALRARHSKGLALFAMEREDAASQSLRSWLMAGLCILLTVGVYSVSAFIVPNLPPEQPEETLVVSLLFTPTANPTISAPTTSLPQPTATFALLPTVAPIATPLDHVPDTPTPEPTLKGSQSPLVAACPSAGSQIISPSNGDHLSGVVEVRGTASIPDFAFYKFEIQWPNSAEWITVQTFDVPVAGGILGYWDTTLLAQEPGAYRFRLVVVENTGNFPKPCSVVVEIDPPSPG